MFPSHRFLPALCLSLGLLFGSATGQDAEQVSRQLEQVRERVAQLQADLDDRRQRESATVAALADAERAIGAAAARLRSIGLERDAEEDRLATLERDQEAAERDLARQRERLGDQLRATWLLARQHRLKLWLDQDDPAALGRTLGYFEYIQRARIGEIGELVAALERLAQLRREIDDSLARLATLTDQARAGEAAARAARDERSDALARLREELRRGDTELAALQVRQTELEELLEALRDAFADIPDAIADRPFLELRGELRWPLERPFLAAPGRRKDGGLQTLGALIEAETGLRVHAIASGRVAYADWLRGFGLLTIIDHGDGFLSLYAFKESLYKEVGDWVRPGEAIGEAGTTGGRDRPALYFELRKDGDPVDPRPWFASAAPGTG